jgi:NAD(P)-dependent dehydrogenase (short-subunit alcohol dehydrogenase family)
MKTFLSIGAGPGIGMATAERFAREGYQVVLAARTVEKVQELAQQLAAKGYSVSAAGVDAADPANVAHLIADTETRFGPVDTIHYNAASLRQASIDTVEAAVFQDDLAVNIVGAYAAIRAGLAVMEPRAEGTLLLTGGSLSLAPKADFLSLSVGKAGIRTLALGLFEDLKKRGIHIATVTVFAHVEPNSDTATAIGNEFFQLRNQAKDAWTAETTFKA